jgi:ribonuclease HI
MMHQQRPERHPQMAKVNRHSTQDRSREKQQIKELKTTVKHLLRHFAIGKYDYLLLGDGSGSQWGYPIGWACVLLERRSGEYRIFSGAANDGTVNFAELMAYITPLTYIDTKRTSGKALDIHIVTDSEYTQSSAHKLSPDKNAGLIGAINAYRRKGLNTHFHWLRRNSHPLTVIADELSKVMRRLVLLYMKKEMADWLQKIHQVPYDNEEEEDDSE